MKELSFTIRETLSSGLRKSKQGSKNTLALTSLKNLKATENGLESIPVVQTPLAETVTCNSTTWPAPQLFRGKKVTLLADSGFLGVNVVDESDWSLTPIVFHATDDVYLDTVEPGDQWHFIDCYDTWFLLNGKCVAYHTNERLLKGLADRHYIQKTVTLNTGCEFRGRLLFGGLDPTNYFNADWESFWDTWTSKQSMGISLSHNMASNFVTWSSIGGGDSLWPLYLDRAISGLIAGTDYSVDKPYLLDVFSRNQAGFMPMPFRGTVRCIKALENVVVVYCDNGIGMLKPVTLDGTATFSYIKVSDEVGVASRSAVGGNTSRHIFLDKKGCLYSLTESGLEKLDYSEVFGSIASTIAISYDDSEKEFYLCNSAKTYILTKTGLCESSQHITSFASFEGSLKAVAIPLTSATAQDTFYIATDTFDMQNRGIKQIGFVEVGMQDTTSVTVQVKYRYSSSEEWRTSAAVPVTKEGSAFLGLAGVEFQLIINGSCQKKTDIFGMPIPATTKVEYATVHWKQSDKRYIRGI